MYNPVLRINGCLCYKHYFASVKLHCDIKYAHAKEILKDHKHRMTFNPKYATNSLIAKTSFLNVILNLSSYLKKKKSYQPFR